ncbi:MAG: hypothetical protein HY758_10040 [Nitrospirae bacterium]|nr:hypothetical protein [Nitrospirota bacterium]
MKTKGIKTLFSVCTVVVFLLCLPIMSSAADISWTTEQYRASVFYDLGSHLPYGADWTTGTSASLPIAVSINENGVILTSSITSSTMDVYWALNTTPSTGASLGSEAYFDGTYIASEPYFIFSSSASDNTYPGFYARLMLQDTTNNNSILFADDIFGSQSLNIATPAGHLIDVSISLETYYPSKNSASLAYSMGTAVAPEPLASSSFSQAGRFWQGNGI